MKKSLLKLLQVFYPEIVIEEKMESGRSVVQDWVSQCTLKQQTVLLSAIRGCDGIAKEDPSKKFTRALRSVVLHNASPDDGVFMQNSITSEAIEEFTGDLDRYPLHWVTHFTHATEIIGYKHPIRKVQLNWLAVYHRLVTALHFQPEVEADLDARLSDGPISPNVVIHLPERFTAMGYGRNPNLDSTSKTGYYD